MSRRRSRMRQQPEAGLALYGTQLLEVDGWRAIKLETVSDHERKRFNGEPGMPDYLYLRYSAKESGSKKWNQSRFDNTTTCQHLWIEWKATRGKVSANQSEWHRNERVRGGVVWVALQDFPATPEGFKTFYEASGLCRKRLI